MEVCECMIGKESLGSVQLLVFDFDGVFTDNTVSVNQDGLESVRCWRSDGIGLSRLKKIGLPIYIISTEKNPVVTTRAEKLKIPCWQSVDDKGVAILDLCRDLCIDPAYVMFVGNDINDIPAFEHVGLPVAVADAYPEVDRHDKFRTKKSGGYGAVREICDLIYFAKLSVKKGIVSE